MTSLPHQAPTSLTTPTGRALIFFSIVFSAFNLRTAVTSLTPLLETLSLEFHFSSTMMGVFGMLPSLSFAVAALLTPMMMRHLNLERTVMLSMVIATVGLLIRALSPTTGVLLISSVLALLGMGIGNVVLPPLVKRYFPSNIGSVSMVYITILQLGTLLPAFLAIPLLNVTHWRFSLGIWGLFSLIAFLSWLNLWRTFPEIRYQSSIKKSSDIPHQRKGRVWRSPVAWGMALMFSMTSLNTYAMFTWLPVIFTHAGATPAFGGSMVGLFAALGLLSALAIPMIAVRVKNIFPFVVLCMVCFIIAYLGLYLAPMSFPVLWVTILGVAPITFPLSLTLINLRTTSSQGSAALSGFVQALGYAISALGPLGFGYFHDLTKSWLLPFIFLSVCVALLGVGGYISSKPRMLEDTW